MGNSVRDTRPECLDLFAGAQGAGVGYVRAGFRVTAVDIEEHPCHPSVAEFVVADALEVESNVDLSAPACGCDRQRQPVGVYGHGGTGPNQRGYQATVTEAREAMGIDWMAHRDVVQAVPPAYTQHLGRQLLRSGGGL